MYNDSHVVTSSSRTPPAKKTIESGKGPGPAVLVPYYANVLMNRCTYSRTATACQYRRCPNQRPRNAMRGLLSPSRQRL